MTENSQEQLGKTLWTIADQLRGAMNADNFRGYMLAFLFLRYLSDNYKQHFGDTIFNSATPRFSGCTYLEKLSMVSPKL